MKENKRVALILPWAGRRPWYCDLWRKSAEGKGFDVIIVEKSVEDFSALINEKIGDLAVQLKFGYKLCDLKPMYGVIFADLLKDYDYWAFGDCDLVYGNKFNEWLQKAVDGDYDIATVQSEFCAGPFTLIRNCEKCNHLFEQAVGWREMLAKPYVTSFDELGVNWFCKMAYGGISYDELRKQQDSFSAVVWHEASAGRLKLLAEKVIREEYLRRGEIVRINDDFTLFHFIAAKTQFGFTGDASSVRISQWKRVSDAVKFGCRLLTGNASARHRITEFLSRKCGKRDWWKHGVWSNRI